MKNEKISIIIPVYNTEKYVEKSINSILNQSYKNIELIIINDGSTDNSEKIIKRGRNEFHFPQDEIVNHIETGIMAEIKIRQRL